MRRQSKVTLRSGVDVRGRGKALSSMTRALNSKSVERQSIGTDMYSFGIDKSGQTWRRCAWALSGSATAMICSDTHWRCFEMFWHSIDSLRDGMAMIRADKCGHGKEKSGRQGRGEAERSHDSLRHCRDWFSFVMAMNSDEKVRQRTVRQRRGNA